MSFTLKVKDWRILIIISVLCLVIAEFVDKIGVGDGGNILRRLSVIILIVAAINYILKSVRQRVKVDIPQKWDEKMPDK